MLEVFGHAVDLGMRAAGHDANDASDVEMKDADGKDASDADDRMESGK